MSVLFDKGNWFTLHVWVEKYLFQWLSCFSTSTLWIVPFVTPYVSEWSLIVINNPWSPGDECAAHVIDFTQQTPLSERQTNAIQNMLHFWLNTIAYCQNKNMASNLFSKWEFPYNQSTCPMKVMQVTRPAHALNSAVFPSQAMCLFGSIVMKSLNDETSMETLAEWINNFLSGHGEEFVWLTKLPSYIHNVVKIMSPIWMNKAFFVKCTSYFRHISDSTVQSTITKREIKTPMLIRDAKWVLLNRWTENPDNFFSNENPNQPANGGGTCGLIAFVKATVWADCIHCYRVCRNGAHISTFYLKRCSDCKKSMVVSEVDKLLFYPKKEAVSDWCKFFSADIKGILSICIDIFETWLKGVAGTVVSNQGKDLLSHVQAAFPSGKLLFATRTWCEELLYWESNVVESTIHAIIHQLHPNPECRFLFFDPDSFCGVKGNVEGCAHAIVLVEKDKHFAVLDLNMEHRVVVIYDGMDIKEKRKGSNRKARNTNKGKTITKQLPADLSFKDWEERVQLLFKMVL
jgi:hypothetical protein